MRIISLSLLFLISIDMQANDPHSCAKPLEAVVRHLELDLSIDFTSKTATGTAVLTIECAPAATYLWLDTRQLKIEEVLLDGNEKTRFHLENEQSFLGRPLRIELRPGTKTVTVKYATTAGAAAMQWLEPEQTEGKKHPFLFTQGEAILSRTWIPIQDSPGIRFTWNAKIQVPKHLMAVMSGKNPQEKSEDGIYNFRMELPVPAYLVALAVGDLEFRKIGDRCGVYAEPTMIVRAENELSDLEKMLLTAEKLYGPYKWGRYDVIVLPPSFPFGGMENPRLTFATPTIITGDKSLTSLIAHELAHSWSGNLVTNSNWDDFWLNEGFTVYFERRIMEALYGKDYSDMLTVLGYQDLQETLDELGRTSPDTRLKLSLEGRDPDDGMSDIAYEKGCFLLLAIEKQVGRERFDAFLNKYFQEFGFKGITTEKFVSYLTKQMGEDVMAAVRVKKWIYEPGLPDNCPTPASTRFALVDSARSGWEAGTINVKTLNVKSWSTHEWLHFLRSLPKDISQERLTELDQAFSLTNSPNPEILFAWFINTIKYDYPGADQALTAFLKRVGRRKFVLPLYREMLSSPRLAAEAREIYKGARPGYHAVTQQSVDELFNKN